MDRQAAFLELATAHAVALRLHDAGREDEAIAQALDIPEASVASLLRIAEAKVSALLAQVDAGTEAGGTEST